MSSFVSKRFLSTITLKAGPPKAHHHGVLPTSSFPAGFVLGGLHAGVKKKAGVPDLALKGPGPCLVGRNLPLPCPFCRPGRLCQLFFSKHDFQSHMQDPVMSVSTPGPAPDSPRSSQSPPPSGAQGDLELELLGLVTALYNLGTTVVNDSTKERDKPGGGKQVGLRV